MIRLLTISCLALCTTACATTKSKKLDVLEKVEVRAAEIVVGETFNVDKIYAQANAAYASGKFAQSLTGYENILTVADAEFEHRIDSVFGYADSALALSSSSEVNRLKAATAYNNLSDRSDLSERHENRLLAGQVLLELILDKSEDAEVRLNEALETNLDDPRLWNALGRFHDRAGEWVLATETYVKAMEAAGETGYPMAPIINNMGMSYLMRERSKDALKKFEQAHSMNTENLVYDNNRRLALVLTGRLDKAVADLSDKRAAQIYNDAGYVSAGRGHTRKARSYYQKAIDLSPTYFEKAELNLLSLASSEAETGA